MKDNLMPDYSTSLGVVWEVAMVPHLNLAQPILGMSYRGVPLSAGSTASFHRLQVLPSAKTSVQTLASLLWILFGGLG